MDFAYLESVAATLRCRGVTVEPGLSGLEISAAEVLFGFAFPQDLRELLKFMLPVGDQFPDWRDGSENILRERLGWPADGHCFDVEHNGLWLSSWGPKPENLQDAFAVARRAVAAAPALIPVYSHRYIPAEPVDSGNPVYSVHQTDIIYYGEDLASYLNHEFQVPLPVWAARRPRRIRFWADVIAWVEAQGDPSLQ
jgi:hypothetical protein